MFLIGFVCQQICKIEIEKEKKLFLTQHAEAKHPKVNWLYFPKDDLQSPNKFPTYRTHMQNASLHKLVRAYQPQPTSFFSIACIAVETSFGRPCCCFI